MVHWFKRNLLTALLGMVLALLALPVPAAQQIFMNVEGVPGESLDSQHRNWIIVSSFSHGISHFQTGGNTNSAPSHSQLSIMKTLDKSSPTLALYCAKETVIPSVNLDFTSATNSQLRYYQISLSNAVVTSTQLSGSAGSASLPFESVSFVYSRIDWTYTQFDATSKSMGSITTFWDLI
ncbi:Hcp family type VI secretion system effector, partial [Pedosphaera parvula]